MKSKFAICIVTYSKRFDIFKQTLNELRKQTGIDVYVAINGDYKQEFNEDYRKKILIECLNYGNVYPTFYLQFRGISKIWNDCIVNCSADHVIVTNDDIYIEEGFFEDFLAHIEQTDAKELIRVNQSFSTYYVNKHYIDSVGYFNEYYLGLGWEDFEFTKRTKQGEYPSFQTTKYRNLSSEYLDLATQNASIQNHKYHNYNYNLFTNREISYGVNYRPYERYYMDNYDTFWTA